MPGKLNDASRFKITYIKPLTAALVSDFPVGSVFSPAQYWPDIFLKGLENASLVKHVATTARLFVGSAGMG